LTGDQNIPEGYVRLSEIGVRIRGGEKVETIRVHELLQWFGATRRNDRTVARINATLILLDLKTEPRFEDQNSDGDLEFREGTWVGGHGPDRLPKIVLASFPAAGTTSEIEVLLNFLIAVEIRLLYDLLESLIEQSYPTGEPPRLSNEEFKFKFGALIAEINEKFLTAQFPPAEYLFAQVRVWTDGFGETVKSIGRMKLTEGLSFPIPPLNGFASLDPAVQHRVFDATVQCVETIGAHIVKTFGAHVPQLEREISDGNVIAGPWVPRVPQRVPESPLRIRRLLPKALQYVKPTEGIKTATTLMARDGLSHLPVMEHENRDIMGVVSWQSIVDTITQRPEIGMDGVVSEYLRKAIEIDADDLFLEGIQRIERHQYAVVIDRDGRRRRILGVLTAKNLTATLQLLTEPFLMIRDIELHIRSLILGVATEDDFKKLESEGRRIETVWDLTFGDYPRLFNEAFWDKLCVVADRKLVVQWLDEIRLIRNVVMHFDPDGLDPDRLNRLRSTSAFLLGLQPMRRSATPPLKGNYQVYVPE
jgi:predicted transcriptional regulator